MTSSIPATKWSTATSPNSNIAFCELLLTEFARAGAAHICICPGSRSAPLAIASQRVPELRPWVHLDERSAAFFALGQAKASGRAVILFCTSGTAAANFYPAVIEAWYGRVPLIVLTADRPAELREWGDGQTIQQTHLFGNHIRWFAEAPLPEANDTMLRTARSLGARAVSIAQGTIKGPVHLNLPFREPLTPEPNKEEMQELKKLSFSAKTCTHSSSKQVLEQTIQELCQLVNEQTQGIILCGEHFSEYEYPAEITRFANMAGWPVIADPLSQLRFGTHTEKTVILSTGDLLLRGAGFRKRMAPGCIIRIGATLTGKAARLWAFEQSECRHVLVDEQQRWNDPDHLVSDFISCNPTRLIHQLGDALAKDSFVRQDRSWFETWMKAEQAARETLSKEFARNSRMLEPVVGESLVACLPDICDLFLASSMPIRDIDTFAPLSTKSIRVFSNRGTNGIDGVISSALGVAADNSFQQNTRQTVLLTGDLTFLHDIGGLLTASRNQLDLTIIVINNDGGGIFSLLPVSQYSREANFDQFFTTPHGLSFKSAAELYGLHYFKVENLSSFKSSLQGIEDNSGTRIIELVVDRKASVTFQKRLVDSVTMSIETSSGSGSFCND
jgi:2-succinyl-5-enolpyruvyl-6-hydroxy-3-cyclohexene-1-carboxylate synthase